MARRTASAISKRGSVRPVSESAIQNEIITQLATHPLVVWAHVTTNGKVNRRGHWFTLGFPGQADIIGQTHDGRILAIEVKKPGEDATDEQQKFIDLVNRYSGRAGVAHDVAEAFSVVAMP